MNEIAGEGQGEMKSHLDRLTAKEEGGGEGDEQDVPDGAMIHFVSAKIVS